MKVADRLQVPRVSDTSGRNLDMDALKGLAILLVVLGHAILTYAFPQSFVSFWANPHDSRSYAAAFIYLFHMPLFAAVSGFVIFGRNISVREKFLRLIVPLLAWIGIHFLIDRFYLHETITVLGSYKEVLIHPEQRLWYLSFLFLSYLCLVPVTRLERWRGYMGEVSLALTFIAFNLIPLNVLGFKQLRNYFFFFALGYLAAKHKGLLARTKPWIAGIVTAGAAVLFLLFFLLFYDGLPHFYQFTGPGDIASHPMDFLQRYGMALLGILASYGLIRLLSRAGMSRPLCWLGLMTMDIYVAHGIMLRASVGAGWVRIATAFASGIILSLALSLLVLRRSKALSAVFLGTKWKKPEEAGISVKEVETGASGV